MKYLNRQYMPAGAQIATIVLAFFIWLPYVKVFLGVLFRCLFVGSESLTSLISARALGLLSNTLLIGAGTVMITLSIGLPTGYFLGKIASRTRRLWACAVLTPILIPPHINAQVWIDLLGVMGPVNTWLSGWLSLQQPPLNIFTTGGAIIVLSLSYYPYLTLFVLSGFSNLDRSLEEAAQLHFDAATTFRRVVLPLMQPYVMAGVLIVFAFATANYGVPALLGVPTYPVEVFADFSTFLQAERAIFSSLPLLFLVILFMVWDWRLLRRLSFGVIFPAQQDLLIEKTRPKAALAFLTVVTLLSVVLPILRLCWLSASWQAYEVAMRTAWQPVLTTLGLGVVSASVAVLIGYLVSYKAVRIRSPSALVLDLFSFLPLAVPGTILGVGLIMVWNRPLTCILHGSAIILIIGYLAQFTPFAIRCLIPSLSRLSPQLEEAYLLKNGSWLSRQWQIVAPLARSGGAVAWTLVFVLSMGELGVTLLVIPPGMETLSLRIYNLMHYGAHEIVAALSVILLSLTLLPLGVLFGNFRFRHPAQ